MGWEVWLDGMEITQFTYFQQMGGYECRPVTAEITYGLERLATYIQGTEDVFQVVWAPGVSFAEVFRRVEYEQSRYGFDVADVAVLSSLFQAYEKEAGRCLEDGIVRPAFDYVLKCSHTFNLLEARGAISVTERTGYLGRIRGLAKACAGVYLRGREEAGFPLLGMR